ncbi:MAG: hypothetical protein ACYCYI_08165 [Saccharofermentanales bacterium]
MESLQKELNQMKWEFGLFEKIYCSKEEQKDLKKSKIIPSDVYKDDQSSAYYRISKADINEDEIKELLSYRKLDYLRSIKNFLLFFVILAIISITVSLFYLFK